MKSQDFEWLTDVFMLYCRSTQLREKTMSSLHLFGRWLSDKLKICTVDIITKSAIRKCFLLTKDWLEEVKLVYSL